MRNVIRGAGLLAAVLFALPAGAGLEPSLLGLPLALLDTFGRFLVEQGGLRCRLALFRYAAHHDSPLHRAAADFNRGTRSDSARRLHPFTGHLHFTAGDGGRRATAGLEETRYPQPLVETLCRGFGLIDGFGH